MHRGEAHTATTAPGAPSAPVLSADPAVMGGRTVFAGTRLPVEVLFENLADGMSLDEILDAYPTLTRERAVRALEEAARRLARDP